MIVSPEGGGGWSGGKGLTSVSCMQYLEANRDKRGLPKSKEPARHKTHWDFVLEEMAWLAKVGKSLARGCLFWFRFRFK